MSGSAPGILCKSPHIDPILLKGLRSALVGWLKQYAQLKKQNEKDGTPKRRTDGILRKWPTFNLTFRNGI